MVETGHFPSWSLIEIRNPCNSSSQTFSTESASLLVRAEDRRRLGDIHVTVPRSLFFANECFGAFADGASKPGEVRVIFPGFVKHDHHRCPASRAFRRSLGSQRIKQKVQVGFHGAAPNAARSTTAEAPEGCLTVRGQICQTLRPSRAS
jgi:hypothetical protein